ncbi:MAG: hypothetical protein JSV86_05710 [Gemmatimonadota bacterium]|nr:MAG: hypothetical protein JSV86_05710 [Gemmatimonadota bacterium]
MARETSNPRVIVLRCRACRAELPAAPNDVAFRCPQCGRGWEIEAGGFIERPSHWVASPAGGSQPFLYLPYWSFSVSAAVNPGRMAEADELGARDKAARFERAWIAAYSIYRPTYVGEWGLAYTRINPKWEVRSGHGPQAPGATISGVDAQNIAGHYILGEIDRKADIGSLDLDLEVGDPELWAIPCYDLGDKIRCPWTRAELAATVLDDLSEIRSAAPRRQA